MNEYLTTTQAAKFCNVTRFTVRNWVIEGKLKSVKTAGGHRRIPKIELIKFMQENNIATINKRDSGFLTPPCYEFRKFKGSADHNCTDCLVFKEKNSKCFMLVKEFGNKKIQCQHDCLNCEYLLTFFPKEQKVMLKMQKGKNEEKRAPSKSTPNNGTVHCWEFDRFKDPDKHNCSECLVFKEKANKCFLLVRQFGKDKIQCTENCLDCEYLNENYPKESKTMRKIHGIEGKEKTGDFLMKGLYTSGKYLASVKNAFHKKEKTKKQETTQ